MAATHSPSRFSRRHFFRQSALVTLAFSGLQRFALAPALGAQAKDIIQLEPDFYGVLDLPAGFSYELFSETGERMDDGFLVPGRHDGMGSFAGPGGTTLLVRNHEVEAASKTIGAFGNKSSLFRKIDPKKLYDPGKGKRPGLGGTTTLVYDTKEGRLRKHFLSLAGTLRNCAGGVTPWNTWISCEETTDAAEGDIEVDHGYNFEVPASDKISLADPIPLKAMGRFRHEAVAVDPRTYIVYQTEDRHDGIFFRFIPNAPGRLLAGGKLQALRIKDLKRADTRNWRTNKFRLGQKVDVEWVDMLDIESPDDDLRYQGYFEQGTTRFARAEGIWYGQGALYFACTNGGAKKKGQIWRYFPSPAEGTAREKEQPGQLELFIEPNNVDLIANCDNVTMAPWGDLVICEDETNPRYFVGVTPEGKIYRLGKTTLSELAGACFSPDGSTLFVNIFDPGMTLAITGPWEKLKALRSRG